MSEIKPVLDAWAVKEVWFDEIGNPAAYRDVPDTRRIVPVELLKEVLQDAYLHPHESWIAMKLIDIIDNKEQISRSEIIDVLLATSGLSEGVTADAILAAMRRQNEI